MRSYLIDEISPDDMPRLKDFLRQRALRAELEDIFWVPVPEDLLSEEQSSHRDCRPHVFAIEAGPGWLKVEFFVRTRAVMTCPCQGPSTPAQRNFAMDFVDRILRELEIRT